LRLIIANIVLMRHAASATIPKDEGGTVIDLKGLARKNFRSPMTLEGGKGSMGRRLVDVELLIWLCEGTLAITVRCI
jgi:hypothetical protein